MGNLRIYYYRAGILRRIPAWLRPKQCLTADCCKKVILELRERDFYKDKQFLLMEYTDKWNSKIIEIVNP